MQNLDQIAGAAVQLAELAPRLEMVVSELETAVAELDGCAAQMIKALAAGRRIADLTRIVAINAAIEAGRAGSSGSAFSAVVEEIQRLADASAESTREVESGVENISTAVGRVSAAAMGDSGAADAGRKVRSLTDLLLTSVGQHRFDAHARAQRALEILMPQLASAGRDRIRTEMVLENWLQGHPWFELAYATDAGGRQFVHNLRCTHGRVTRDPSALDQDWSARPWFRNACAQKESYVTDLYRSAATGDFCFTVSASWQDREGALAGVVGADVNFGRIVIRLEQGAAAAI